MQIRKWSGKRDARLMVKEDTCKFTSMSLCLGGHNGTHATLPHLALKMLQHCRKWSTLALNLGIRASEGESQGRTLGWVWPDCNQMHKQVSDNVPGGMGAILLTSAISQSHSAFCNQKHTVKKIQGNTEFLMPPHSTRTFMI